VPCGKVANFDFKVKSLMLELTENVEPTIFLTPVAHANHYTIKVVLYATKYNSLWQVTNIKCIMAACSFGIISVNETNFFYIS
jgi:hypothetical protein